LEYRALQAQIRELHRLLGKKTLETEILKEALEVAAGPKNPCCARCPVRSFGRNNIWERVFAALTDDRDNQSFMIDSTIARAHQHAACAREGPASGVGAFPRWTDHQNP
jgi:hypothetical protein